MERHVYPRSALLDQISVLLSGRIAEEIVLGEPGSGAANDLARASQIARMMVRDLGMSELGVLAQDRFADGSPLHTDQATSAIDAEARKLLDEAGEQAERILKRGRKALDRLVEALLEEETLNSEQIGEIVEVAKPRARAR